jgi:hypothetical protein
VLQGVEEVWQPEEGVWVHVKEVMVQMLVLRVLQGLGQTLAAQNSLQTKLLRAALTRSAQRIPRLAKVRASVIEVVREALAVPAASAAWAHLLAVVEAVVEEANPSEHPLLSSFAAGEVPHVCSEK